LVDFLSEDQKKGLDSGKNSVEEMRKAKVWGGVFFSGECAKRCQTGDSRRKERTALGLRGGGHREWALSSV